MAADYRLLEKTLALAVETLDVYLEHNAEKLSPEEYPFLGLAALFMASKYEEIYPPTAQQFIFRGARKVLSNPHCLAKDISPVTKKLEYLKKRMFFHEAELLRCLKFDTSRALAIDFLNYFAEDAGFNAPTKRYFYSLYLLNVSYLSPRLRSSSQSLLAFAIVYFVNRIFSRDEEWPATRSDTSGRKLRIGSKKIAYLHVNMRFADARRFAHDFRARFRTALDDVCRIGEAPRLCSEQRFLSKFSNSFCEMPGQSSQPGQPDQPCLVEHSCPERETGGSTGSLEGSGGDKQKGDTGICSVFTQKTAKARRNEDKSTGLSRVGSGPVPTKTISSFRVLAGRPCGADAGGFRDIEFDFSRVKAMAMDVFNGRT